MESIGNLITQPLPEPKEPVSNGGENRSLEQINQASFSKGILGAAHFERLWTRMAETFGHKWTSNYGTVPNRAWMDGLADMSVMDIQRGLTNLKGWFDDDGWPPTLLQFRDLCRPQSAPAHTQYQRLPEPRTALEYRKLAAEKAFAELKAGCLQSEQRGSVLNPDDEILARVLAGDDDPVIMQTAEQIKASAVGCTCAMEPGVTGRYVRVGRLCPVCKELMKGAA